MCFILLQICEGQREILLLGGKIKRRETNSSVCKYILSTYLYVYIFKYAQGKNGRKKGKKRVSETYFSSFISPERKENSVTSTAAEGRLSAAPALVVPSFDSVYFSRFRIFLVHYQREATIHTAATAPHLVA